MGGGGGGRWTGGDYKSLIEEAKKELRKSAGEGKKNVFLSFAYEDVNEVNLLRGQSRNPRSDLEFNDWSVKEPFDSSRAEYIKQKIGERISQCSVVVVYLSNSTPQSRWVEWEVDAARRQGKEVLCVHSGDQAPNILPEFVRKHGLRTIRWADLPAALSD